MLLFWIWHKLVIRFSKFKIPQFFLDLGSPKFSKFATIVSRRMQLGIKIASISFLLPLYMASNIIQHQVNNMLYYFCLFNNICFFLAKIIEQFCELSIATSFLSYMSVHLGTINNLWEINGKNKTTELKHCLGAKKFEK